MTRRRRVLLGVAGGLAAAAIAGVLIHRVSRIAETAFVSGAVLRDDADPNKQRPIGNTTITAVAGPASGRAVSDATGFFRLELRPRVLLGQDIHLTFRHPDYQPLEVTRPATDEIEIARLKPIEPAEEPKPDGPSTIVANIRLRYSVTSTSSVNVGSAVKTFEIVNKGNVPCGERPPCSPDGKWRATVGSVSLDAGSGKQFSSVRLSCIAGPCPFTRVDSDGYSRGGRLIGVSIRNWSDPVTYLLEAEVAQPMVSDIIRHSYPVIFGRSMNFTLPATAQGPSIEAEVDGSDIVFPLGPKLILSWATCKLELGSDRTKLYRCELKPRYRFK